MSDNKSKKLAIIALLLSFMAIGISESITTTTVGVQWVVNNTNLAPFVAGHGGVGERIGDNTTYWNNATPIQIFLYSHANTTGQAAEIHLFINGTKVSDTSGRALGIAEQSNRSIVATVPQYSFYSVEMVNFHHYEWYEYKILTGNVTTSIIGCSVNCSFDKIYTNLIGKNNTTDSYLSFIELVSPFMKKTTDGSNKQSSFDLNNGNYAEVMASNTSSGEYSSILTSPTQSIVTVSNGITNQWVMNETKTTYSIDTTTYQFNQTSFDVGGSNITNSPTIDSKVNKSGDTMTGNLSFNYNRIQNASFLSLKNLGTSGFDIQNANTNIVNSLAVGNLGNTNTYGNWNSTINNVSVPGNNVWALRLGVAGTQADFFKLIWLKANDPDYGNDIAGTSQNTVLEWYKNESVKIMGNITATNLTGVGNAYVCVNASGVLYRGNPTC